jgi:hypothetical protein
MELETEQISVPPEQAFSRISVNIYKSEKKKQIG